MHSVYIRVFSLEITSSGLSLSHTLVVLQLRLLSLALAVVALELGGGVLSNVLHEVINLPASLIGLRRLCVLREPEKGGEPTDVELGRHIVGGHFLSELLVDGSQLLAVSAPRGVELNQDILLRLGDQLVEVPGHSGLHALSLVVGQSL